MKIIINTLSYGNKKVLCDVNIEVYFGEFIHLIGKNGSGKSSFFNALLGNRKYVGDIEISPQSIAVVSDYAQLPLEVRGADIISFLKNTAVKEQKIEELLNLLQLKGILNQKIKSLSSGEKRKLEILAVLVSNKKVIVYDEITNALDKSTKDEILKFIKEYHRNNPDTLAFYTTHNLSETFYLGGRYLYINPESKKIEDISNACKEEIVSRYTLD